MRTLALLIASLLVLKDINGRMVGGKTPVDINDPRIQEFASGAFEKIRSQSNQELRFVRIIEGTQQVSQTILQ
ncbi:hypothetical protein C0J52_23980 [Blattella germanica]|nr:hypothetical protein C0J52_23980 [Blattella germanica]